MSLATTLKPPTQKKKKKHHAITPEVIPSPPQSDVDKNDILNDEEIQALSINVDELEKVRVFSCKNQNEMKRLELMSVK